MRLSNFCFLSALLVSAAGAARSGEPTETDRLRARLTAEVADSLAGRTGRSDLVCVAEPVKVRDDGAADCRVTAVLKGGIRGEASLKDKIVRVRFKPVFGGLQPQRGVSAIYFLKAAPAEKDGIFSRSTPTFRLISDVDGLAAPTEDGMAAVRLAAAGGYGVVEEPRVARLEMPAPESLEGMALDAAFVALGTVQEVSLPDPKSKEAGCAAQLTFRVERVFKGDLKPGVVPNMYVPGARPEFIGPDHKPLVPRVGVAAVFFRRERDGDSYRLLSPYRGYVPAEGPDGAAGLTVKLAAAIEAEARLRSLGLIGNNGGHDSVADTIRTWTEAWNTRTDVEACVACYSRQSPWRRKWESGPEARREMAATMADYPAKINVICDRVEEKDKDRAQASVRIQVIVTDPTTKTDSMQVRTTVMTFVHENSQWLILDEGN